MFSKKPRSLLLGTALLFSRWTNDLVFATPSLSGNDVPPTYATWLLHNGRNYESNKFLGRNDEFAVHWKIDGDQIHLAAAVAATGWISFGLSESGGMKGADMFVYTAANNEVVDVYATAYEKPSEDSCQDWKLKNATIADEDGFMVVEVSRSLTTDDDQDHDFYDDSLIASHRVIAAWGNQPQLSFHGANDMSLGFIRFYAPQGPIAPVDEIIEPAVEHSNGLIVGEDGDFSIELRAPDNYIIPTNQTTYEDFCFSAEDLGTLGLNLTSNAHFIGAHYLEGGNDEFVHHITLFGFEAGGKCKEAFQPVWLWAHGSEDFSLPSNVGLPFGPGGLVGFKMEVHYNNPSMTSGKSNRSGGRLTFTTNLRDIDAAAMVVGDPLVSLNGVPIGEGWSEWDFNCPSSCTEKYLDREITVFGTGLHMHESGERMVFKQYNMEGEEIETEYVDNYDFNQAGAYEVPKQPFKVNPGDSFDVVCYYNEEPFGDNRTFGIASFDEMCQAFLWYYPRVPTFPGLCGHGIDEIIPGCGSNFTYTKLEDESKIGRTFGKASEVCSVDLNDATAEDVSLLNDGSGGCKRLRSGSFVVALFIAVVACATF